MAGCLLTRCDNGDKLTTTRLLLQWFAADQTANTLFCAAWLTDSMQCSEHVRRLIRVSCML
jgi:hypothetical protein